LIVEARDGRNVGEEEVVVVAVQGSRIARIRRAEAVPEGGSLQLQGVGLRALELESGGGDTNTLLDGAGGLEEGGLLHELLAVLGVGRLQGGGFFLQRLGNGESFITKLGRGGGGRRAGAGGAGVGRGHGDAVQA
jgi:hypothetical protein